MMYFTETDEYKRLKDVEAALFDLQQWLKTRDRYIADEYCMDLVFKARCRLADVENHIRQKFKAQGIE